MLDRYTPDSPEQWLPVPGFPDYEASSHGRIASIKRGEFRILSGGKTEMGYRNVLLYSGGIRVGRRVHQLVALTFHGPRPEGLEIRHLDGNQLNNAASNLAYGTREENLEDKRRHAKERPLRPLPTHCRAGHEYDEANTYLYRGRGARACRACQRDSMRARRARRAAEIRGAA